jgi:hypothetical protein
MKAWLAFKMALTTIKWCIFKRIIILFAFRPGSPSGPSLPGDPASPYKEEKDESVYVNFVL